MIEKSDALKLLNSPSSNERLRGARALRSVLEQNDLVAIQGALFREENRWVKSALRNLLNSDNAPLDRVDDAESSDEEDELFEQMRAEVLRETTQAMLHEIRPIVGRLDLNASREIPNYQQGDTFKECARLKRFLDSLEQLRIAASPTVLDILDISELVRSSIESFPEKDRFILAGTSPFLVKGAINLIELIIINALRNSLEACRQEKSNITINWGNTDTENWLAILDNGIGLPVGGSNVFKMFVSNKAGHLGMGLHLSQQAASSLGGKVFLRPRSTGGTAFELRWKR